MPLEYTFRCPLANGLHARPASHLADAAARFKSSVTLNNLRAGTSANAASVLELVAAGLLFDDPCRLEISGADEADALNTLGAFIEQTLPGCDAPLPAASAQRAAQLPRILQAEAVTLIAGTPLSPGTGIGQLVHLGGLELPAAISAAPISAPQAEQARFEAALAQVTARLQAQLDRTTNHTAVEIQRAVLALTRDAALSRMIAGLIATQRHNAAQAVVAAVRHYSAQLAAAPSAYLRERVVDLHDIGAQLLELLTGAAPAQPQVALTAPSIVHAANLAPRQLLALDRGMLQGLLLTDAGATAHAVILARAFGIPVIGGASDAAALPASQLVVADADRGLVLTPVTAAVARFYRREIQREKRRQAFLTPGVAQPARTQDGLRIEIAANIATAAEAATAAAQGAEGVGLFRTEIIFTAANTIPAEDEQYAVYRSAVEALGGRTIIFRTIDVGGDKPLPYLSLPAEDNPFLGYRGLRIYHEHRGVIEGQVRAMLRASAHGPVWIMAPMVSTVEEAQWFCALVAQEHARLQSQGIACAETIPVGIMIEVPSVALLIDQLSGVVDFFSIGTNDLCQYLFAVDRGNLHVARLYNVRHPAFLRLLQQICSAARQHGKWVGMCGEMARHEGNLPLLVGLELNELSLSAPQIPAVRSALARLDSVACRHLLAEALACRTAAEVDVLLERFAALELSPPLIAPELVQFDADCVSKAEVLKELADLLYICGRTSQPEQVEDALWAREAEFSTGLGYGFAIPHCKTDSVGANTMAVLKLRQPVDWGALDGKPVTVVILLAIRASDPGNVHLQLFAKLARKLMHDEFRAGLKAAPASAELLDYLARELEI